MFQAWTLWKDKNALQLIDSSIKDSCVIPEVLRCIHVSLLCLQQYPGDRPTMTSVIQMLGSEMELVEPKELGFFQSRTLDEGKLSFNLDLMTSNDELTITSLNGRWKLLSQLKILHWRTIWLQVRTFITKGVLIQKLFSCAYVLT